MLRGRVRPVESPASASPLGGGPSSVAGADPSERGFERTRLRRVPVLLRQGRGSTSASQRAGAPSGEGASGGESCLRKPTRRGAVLRSWRRPIGAWIRTHPASPCAGLALAGHQVLPPQAHSEGGRPVAGADPSERGFERTRLRRVPVLLWQDIKSCLRKPTRRSESSTIQKPEGHPCVVKQSLSLLRTIVCRSSP
jgi:hypothetical protein